MIQAVINTGENVFQQTIDSVLFCGDKAASGLTLTFVKDVEDEEVTDSRYDGWSGIAYFIRADGETVQAAGCSVVTSGVISFPISEEALSVEGQLQIAVRLTDPADENRRTVYWAEGNVTDYNVYNDAEDDSE